MAQNLLSSNPVTRIKSLETKYNLLAEQVLVINKNMIEEYKNISADTKTINNDLKKIKTEIDKLKITLRGFLREMENFAKKQDIKVLEKYIKLWNPMEFVTSEELNKALKEVKKNSKSK